MRQVFSIVLLLCISTLAIAQDQSAGAPFKLAGLIESAEVIRDSNGIAHIRAANEHDLIFLQGFTHAQDRFFQMDFFRHVGSGTLAELVGTSALPQDVQTRTWGLRRAAARSMAIQSPRLQAMLQAYADGVNAYLADHPLPPEYAVLGVTKADPWQPLDSLTVAKLLTFKMNFNTADLDHTVALMSYQLAGKALGFDGAKLFFEDLFRSAPFDTAATIPDASLEPTMAPRHGHLKPELVPALGPEALDLTKRYLDDIKDLEFFKKLRDTEISGGSNGWVVGGQFTASGAPLMANDPHLTLDSPTIWYPIHLSASELDVIGNSFAGTPLVVLGHNRWIAWGSTTALGDVLDFYQEQVVPDGSSPSGLSTLYQGTLEHVIPIPETYRARMGGQLVTVPPGNGIPAATLTIPRRNNGPIVQFDATSGKAISMQWTGFSGTRELDAALTWAEARDPSDFETGVRQFATSQNWLYVDRKGNFGYYMSGAIPIREDLQAGTIAGLPPNLLRNGQGGNEWLPVEHPQPQQTLPYEILPADEMPHVLNPPAGWVVNANNDPLGLTFDNNPLGRTRPGGGIYFLTYGYHLGIRAGRITEMLKDRLQSGKVTVEDMQKMQADTVLRDAQFFVPFITQAFDNASRGGVHAPLASLASDPAVAEAVGRLRKWDFTSPTGLSEGFDAGDIIGQSSPPSSTEIASSVAATIYSMWRSQFLQAVIDAKLRPYGLPVPDTWRAMNSLHYMLESFATNNGVGASGINFFAAPGIAGAADRRDLYILQAVKNALTALAADSFRTAFGNSTDQNDYRWGKLHRLTMAHPLGSIFSVPPAGGSFPSPLAGLPGIPVDGGYESVDVGSNLLRANDQNGVVFSAGPSERSVAEALPSGVKGVSSLPGGISGALGSPLYNNLLAQYLVNGSYDQLFRTSELQTAVQSVTKYEP